MVQYEEDNFLEQEIAEKVKTEWGVIYRECSAQNAESVSRIFKNLMEVIEENGVDHGIDEHDMPKKCVIL